MASDAAEKAYKAYQAEQAYQAYLAESAKHAAPQEEPGMLEALGRGAEQGATLGFAPRINAVVSSLSKGTDYAKELEESKANFEAARTAHPVVTGLGNVAGGLAGAAALPLEVAGAGAAGALGTGALLGGIGGVAESDLSSPADIAKHAAIGAGLGAVTGGALHGIGAGLSDAAAALGSRASTAGSTVGGLGLVGNTAAAARQGYKGNLLFGKRGTEIAEKSLSDAQENARTTIQKELTEQASQKAGALTESAPVDMEDFAHSADDLIAQARDKFPSSRTQADLDKIQGLLNEHFESKGQHWGADDIDILRHDLGELSHAGENPLASTVGKQIATKLITGIDNTSGEASNILDTVLPNSLQGTRQLTESVVPGQTAQDKLISQLTSAKENLPTMKDISTLDAAGKVNPETKQSMGDYIASLPDSIKEGIAPQLQNAAEQNKIQEIMNRKGVLGGYLSPDKYLFGGANTAGFVAGGVADAGAALGKTLYTMAPEQIQTLATTVSQLGSEAGKKLGTILQNAAGKDRIGRNALLYSIQQNPEYRAVLNQAAPNATKP